MPTVTPVIEVVKFETTDAYKQDQSVINEAAKLVLKGGAKRAWHGLQCQDPSYGYIVVAWDRLEDHTDLMNDKEEYPKLVAALGKASAKILTMYHAKFAIDVTPALDAPCTEIVVWSLNENTERTEFRAGVQGLMDTIYSELKEEVYGGTVGDIVEDQKKLSVILGWQSVERFTEKAYGSEKVVSTVGFLKKGAELELKHANLIKYSPTSA